MIVYKVINQLNGEVYIGQTIINLRVRKRKHFNSARNGSDCYFHNALGKYGPGNFKWQVICICPDIDSMNEREQFYIAFHDSFKNGYNQTTGGLNHMFSETTKDKMRITALNMSDETKAKIRVAKLENNWMAGRTGKKNHFYNKKHTDKTRAKMRKSRIEYLKKHPTVSKETREKLRILALNMSDEHKNKIRQSVIKYWQNEKTH